MSRAEPQVNFRMPAALKARLEEAAGENKRSITAELVARLEATFHDLSAKSRGSMGIPGLGLQGGSEPQLRLTPEPEAARSYALEIERQQEQLQQAVAQAMTPLVEQLREDIRRWLEQAQTGRADVAAQRRPPPDETKPAHPAASARKARNTGLRTPKK